MRSKEKSREQWKKWYAANKEHRRAYSQARRKADPLKVRGESTRWEKEHPTYRAEYQRKRRAENPELYNAKARLWRSRHPEAVRSNNGKVRASRRGAGGHGISEREMQQFLADSLGLCMYCSQPCKVTLDHIDPLSRGGLHELSNGAPSCFHCNASKNDTPLLAWLAKRPYLRAA